MSISYQKGQSQSFIIFLLVIAAIVVLGYLVLKNPSGEPSPAGSLQKSTDPETRQDCEAVGGSWGTVGLSRNERCNLKASDAGQPCTDSNQCEGKCIAQNSVAAVGLCSEFRIVTGCYTFLKDGQPQPLVCID